MERLYTVDGDESRDEAWSSVRLPFEPKGADERCGYFALVGSARQEALTVSVLAL